MPLFLHIVSSLIEKNKGDCQANLHIFKILNNNYVIFGLLHKYY